MKNSDYVITYDIKSAKRLSKISKTLEKCSFRIQNSVFFYPSASPKQIKILEENLTDIMHLQEDDIRIYKVDAKASLSFFSAVKLDKINIIS